MQNEELRECILNTVKDTMGRLLYYDRKEDESLPPGKIEECIKEGIVNVDEIMGLMRSELVKSCSR